MFIATCGEVYGQVDGRTAALDEHKHHLRFLPGADWSTLFMIMINAIMWRVVEVVNNKFDDQKITFFLKRMKILSFTYAIKF